MLTPKQEKFCQLRADPNCPSDSVAYKGAYDCANMKATSISRAAFELLQNPKVSSRIRELKKEQTVAVYVDAAWVLNEWLTLATANPRELIQTLPTSCRHCWGEGFGYQWKNEREYTEELEAVERFNSTLKPGVKPKPFPDLSGGFGYRRMRGPNAECPECEGNGGEPFLKIADMRNLSPGAAKLYAGIKQTANGIEIKMHSQDGARENIAKHLGMFTENLRLIMPEVMEHKVTHDIAPGDAAKLYQAIVSGGK